MNKELLKGTTDLLILRLLKREPMYGYGLIQQLDLISKGTFKFKEGTLYPILHQLEQSGYIESFWRESDIGRKRKYYQITDSGLKQLEMKEAEWHMFSGAIGTVLGS